MTGIPIRWRLTLAFGVAMAVVLVVLGAFMYLRLADDLLASVDMGLRSRAQIVVDAIGGQQEPAVVSGSGGLIDPDEAFAQVLDASGQIVDAGSAVAETQLLTAADVSSIGEPAFFTTQPAGFDDPVRLLAIRVAPAGQRTVVVVGATLGDRSDALTSLVGELAVAGPLALALATAGAWLLAGAALRPVEQMRREAAALSASEPGRRLRVPATRDELARLATTLNTMLGRLQEALEREHRFVDDASHELRTPLATLRAEIDLGLTRSRTADELKASLRSAQEDVDRLQRLAGDLLVLARSRGGRIPVRRISTSLGDIVAGIARSVEPAADAAGIRVEGHAADGSANVDPARVEQALRNLVDNAIAHTPRGGVVGVTASRDETHVRFVVDDTGSGFPPDLLPRVFDPFVRAADATAGGPSVAATHADGTGLGLAIVLAVAEAHGGSAIAENTANGARVTLELRDRP